MIKVSQEYGIEVGIFIMLGYLGEIEKDLKVILNYLIDVDFDYYILIVVYFIKGMLLYEEVENLFVEDLDWDSSMD